MSERADSPSRFATRLAWSLAAVGVVFLIIGGIWESAQGTSEGGWLEDLALLLAFGGFPFVGAMVVGRYGWNPLAWVMIGIGFFGGLVVFSAGYAIDGLTGDHGLPGATFAAWLANWTWYPTIQLVLPFLFLFYPTGSLPSPRWRPVLWVASGLLLATTILPMFQERLTQEEFYNVDNPIGLSFVDDAEGLLTPAFVLLMVVAALAVVSLVVRFRRSRGDERMQLKWFTFAGALLVASTFLEELLGAPGYFFSIGIGALPIAMGIAILRYRLYEIDVLINRALVYALLTGLAVALYLGLVVSLQLVLDSVTQDSDLAVAASTLAVAALVRPLRTRIQAFIDRRFYRRKYDAGRAVSDFTQRLRDEVDLEVVESDVLTVLKDTVQPTHASLWLRGEVAR
jgi:hypothetical protein